MYLPDIAMLQYKNSLGKMNCAGNMTQLSSWSNFLVKVVNTSNIHFCVTVKLLIFWRYLWIKSHFDTQYLFCACWVCMC